MRMTKRLVLTSGIAGALCASAFAANLTITVENLSPSQGTFLTPVWFGFHDGSFDLFNQGSPASEHLERMAEDGDLAPLRSAFAAAGAQFRDGVVIGAGGAAAGPLDPGEIASTNISVDASNGRYFSFASMVIPSNDAFVGNGNPMAYAAFDAGGNFQPFSFVVLGSQVWDAGTEVNDEIPAHTAFFGQAAPNTGVDENGVVRTHGGFIPGGAILSDPMFANADFTAAGYQVLRVTVVPTPGVGVLLAMAGLGGSILRRR